MTQKRKLETTSAMLHILAMGFMLCDHLWAVLFPAAEWLTCIGRIAFPIFAFLTAEGYAHTHNLRRYLLRIFLWACLSEIPFNLMYGGSLFYPYHQNVLWTFLLSLLLIALIEKCRSRFRPVLAALLSGGLAVLVFLLGYTIMADYYGVGVFTVLVFHFFRGQGWKSWCAQFLFLFILNVEFLGGYCYVFQIMGREIEVTQQAFALAALLPIWLYRGRQGLHRKSFQYACYAFYPAHILVLLLLRRWML